MDLSEVVLEAEGKNCQWHTQGLVLMIGLLLCLSTPRASQPMLVVPKTTPPNSSPFSSRTQPCIHPSALSPQQCKGRGHHRTYPKDGCPPRITPRAESEIRASELGCLGLRTGFTRSCEPDSALGRQDAPFDFVSVQMSSLSDI